MLAYNEALQRAIFTVLTAEGLTVYDHVPQAADGADPAEFPYVTVGEAAEQQANTDTSNAAELAVTLHIWSRYAGKQELQRIWRQIYERLHRRETSVAVSDYQCVYFEFDTGETLLDPDGITHHGAMTFRVYLDTTDGS